MLRRGISEAEQHVRAVQGARRISQGERPGYRLGMTPDGAWTVVGLPGVSVAATGRREAPDPARAVIAARLDVPADAFHVEA